MNCNRCCIQFWEAAAHQQHLKGDNNLDNKLDNGYVCYDVSYLMTYVHCMGLQQEGLSQYLVLWVGSVGIEYFVKLIMELNQVVVFHEENGLNSWLSDI